MDADMGTSASALRVALRRAAHQVYDLPPLVLEDQFAVRLLGEGYAAELARTATRVRKPSSAALRAFLVGRSRFAEDALAEGVRTRGARQYVLLGAGLDTFSLRNPHAGVRVFEVDHPATQAWKRGLLAAAGLREGYGASLVAADLEESGVAGALRESGWEAGVPTVFAALGVVPYLTVESFRAVVAMVKGEGAGLVFDYAQPRAALPEEEQRERDSLASRVAQAGEPLRLFLTPEEARRELGVFARVEDMGAAEMNARYFAGRTDALRVRGEAGRVVCAWV